MTDVEVVQRQNRGAVAGIYLHVSIQRPALVRAIYAALKKDGDSESLRAVSHIEIFARDFCISLEEPK